MCVWSCLCGREWAVCVIVLDVLKVRFTLFWVHHHHHVLLLHLGTAEFRFATSAANIAGGFVHTRAGLHENATTKTTTTTMAFDNDVRHRNRHLKCAGRRVLCATMRYDTQMVAWNCWRGGASGKVSVCCGIPAGSTLTQD